MVARNLPTVAGNFALVAGHRGLVAGEIRLVGRNRRAVARNRRELGNNAAKFRANPGVVAHNAGELARDIAAAAGQRSCQGTCDPKQSLGMRERTSRGAADFVSTEIERRHPEGVPPFLLSGALPGWDVI